jgi:hypothetical protein
VKLAYGLLGDLADCFPNGEIKHLLLSEWVASELRSKLRMPTETKKTLRWAREVWFRECQYPFVHRSLVRYPQMVKRATT